MAQVKVAGDIRRFSGRRLGLRIVAAKVADPKQLLAAKPLRQVRLRKNLSAQVPLEEYGRAVPIAILLIAISDSDEIELIDHVVIKADEAIAEEYEFRIGRIADPAADRPGSIEKDNDRPTRQRRPRPQPGDGPIVDDDAPKAPDSPHPSRPAGPADRRLDAGFLARERANKELQSVAAEHLGGKLRRKADAASFARRSIGNRPIGKRQHAFFVAHADDPAPALQNAREESTRSLRDAERRGIRVIGDAPFDEGPISPSKLADALSTPLIGRIDAQHAATKAPCARKARAKSAMETAEPEAVDQPLDEPAEPAVSVEQRLADVLARSGRSDQLSARPTEDDVANNLDGELKPGPADVAAHYDFPVLYVAWKDTWQAVFDGKVEGDLKELYESMIEVVPPQYLDPPENSAEATELEQLLAHLQGVTNSVGALTPAPDHILEWNEVEDIEKVWGALSPYEQQRLKALYDADTYCRQNAYRLHHDIDPKTEEMLDKASKDKKIERHNYAYWQEASTLAAFNNLFNRYCKYTEWSDFDKLPIEYRYNLHYDPSEEDVGAQAAYVARLIYKPQTDRTLRDIDEFAGGDLSLLPTESIWDIYEQGLAAEAAQELVHAAKDAINNGDLVNPLGRAQDIINQLQRASDAPYQFDVFAPDSCNFGLLVNYRQKWQPLSYQAGNLAGTIPLAPGETRSFEVKHSQKSETNSTSRRSSTSSSNSESGSTARSEGEIVQRINTAMRGGADFGATSHGGFLGNGGEVNFGGDFSADMASESSQAKKSLQEMTRKMAQEYKDEHAVEISASSSFESSYSSKREISNPNNELTVTYLFYELQRRFEVSQRLNDLTPVILVAFRVPDPSKISEAFIIRHAWILRKVLLDPQLQPVLTMLTRGFVGDEVDVEILEEQWKLQLSVVAQLRTQMQSHLDLRDEARHALDRATSEVKNIPDSSGNKKKMGQEMAQQLLGEAAEEEAARQSLDWADLDFQKAESNLREGISALERATEAYVAALRQRLDQRHMADQLILHVKDNILYYMQAIWLHEPTDQRYLRLYDVKIDWPEGGVAEFRALRTGSAPPQAIGSAGTWIDPSIASGAISFTPGDTFTKRWLHEVADLDTIMGFRGNYVAFRAREPNAVTTYMLQDFLDAEFGLMDPDISGELPTAEEAIEIAKCQWSDPELTEAERGEIAEWLVRALDAAQAISQEVIVPTGELFIEALPGSHPVLEDYKLRHRAADARRAEITVASDEVELLRKAGRVMAHDLDDPDIDKVIRIEGEDANINVDSE